MIIAALEGSNFVLKCQNQRSYRIQRLTGSREKGGNVELGAPLRGKKATYSYINKYQMAQMFWKMSVSPVFLDP